MSRRRGAHCESSPAFQRSLARCARGRCAESMATSVPYDASRLVLQESPPGALAEERADETSHDKSFDTENFEKK
jgi:hypothetical protein